MRASTLDRVKIKLRKILASRLPVKKYLYENNHLIFADPRGGSTWLMEMIQLITAEPIVWEPLNLKVKNSSFKALKFNWRQFIPEEEVWPEAKEAFLELFSGDITNSISMEYSTLLQIINSKTLLFKFCRGNALLPWITTNFYFNNKPIYMIRHPFAIVSSQLRHGGWNYDYSGFNIPDSPFIDFYLTHHLFLETLSTKEEMLVATWCISNQRTLQHQRNNINWLTINYEELLANPRKTFARIIDAWDIKFDLDRIDFTKNSRTTRKDSSANVDNRIKQWVDRLDKAQIKKMTRVLDYFEIEAYTKEPYPKIIYNYG